MAYTSTVKYFTDPVLFADGFYRFDVDRRKRHKIDADNPIYGRGDKVFCQRGYMYPSPPVFMGQLKPAIPIEPVYALRLLLKQPGSEFVVPKSLLFLDEFIRNSSAYQAQFFPNFDERFVYITVRSGPMISNREDMFHADGYQGTAIARHIPEQNYLWANSYPTLFSLQPYFVENLDAGKHNIHEYFDAATDRKNLYEGLEGGIYLIDPMHVHARRAIPEGTIRSVARITYSPVEFRDDTSTVNPELPRGPYNRDDPRNHLWHYAEQNPELKFGLKRVDMERP